MLHINLDIIFIHCIKLNLNLKEFQESINYSKSYQVNKIGYFVESYFHLNIHLNLNIKLDFQVNFMIQYIPIRVMCEVKEFFSVLHHVIMTLIAIHNLYHDLKDDP